MATVRYGRYVTESEVDYGYISDNQQQACIYGVTSKTLIVYGLGGWLGYASGDPKFRLFISNVNSGGPSYWLTYTGEKDADALYVNNVGQGASEVHDTLSAQILTPGAYAIGVTCQGGQLAYSMRQASAINAADRNFYWKSGLSTTIPTNPIGGSPSYQGHMSLWAETMENEKPNVPTNLYPTGQINNSDTTPDLEADFSDPNEVLPNGVAFDHLNGVHVQVRRADNLTVVWDHTYTATNAERDNDRSKVTYAGSALSPGVTYQWRVQHSDRAGFWSNWSGWVSFTVAPAGTVGVPSAPTGKVNTVTPGPFVASWSSPLSASTATVGVRLKVNGVVVRSNTSIAKSVASGGSISVSWAETGFDPLSWGVPYTVEMYAVDTNTVPSGWSNAREFRTNSSPLLPSNPSPSGGTIHGSRPLLTCTASDPDGDSITVYADIFDENESLLYSRAMSYNAGTGRYEYQTTSTDLPSFDNYSWRATATDGVLWSGYGFEAAFVYAQAPDVTVTDPTADEVHTSSTINFAWTTTDQAKRKISIYAIDGTPVYSYPTVGMETSDLQTISISDAPLYTDTFYYAIVSVENDLGLVGSSSQVYFSLDYPPADSLTTFTAEPVALGYDTEPSAILLRWNQTAYTMDNWQEYEIGRTPLSGPQGTVNGNREIIATLTSASQTVWLDAEGASGVTYRYDIQQVITVGLNKVYSLPLEAEGGLSFHAVVLGVVTDPEAYHAELLYPADPGEEGEWEWRPDVDFYLPVGHSKPIALPGTLNTWDPSGTFRIKGNSIATARQRLLALQELAEQMKTVCFRDGRGEVRYVFLYRVEVLYRSVLQYEVEVSFREIDRDFQGE